MGIEQTMTGPVPKIHPPERACTREEFAAWREMQPLGRFERIDGRIVAMAPERGSHLRMKAAIWLALREASKSAGVPCQALPDGATVQAGDNDFEPDAIVNCGEAMADDATVAPNPVVVVEVLSPSTASIDTGGKLAGYFAVPSIVHYLIVHPVKRVIIHHRRNEKSGIDTRIIVSGDIKLDPPGITLAVQKIYDEAAA